jgi:hypothetical protein
MLSGKYHIGSLVAVFLALGIGILIGGTMGQNWVDQTEARIVDRVLDKYEAAMQENQIVHKQLASLQMMNRSISPILEQKQIWWINSKGQEYNMLAMAASSLGAVWEEKQAEEVFKSLDKHNKAGSPDILVFSDSDTVSKWHVEWLQRSDSLSKMPLVIDASRHSETWNDPKEIAAFIVYLKHIVEEDQHAGKSPIDIYHYSGLE